MKTRTEDEMLSLIISFAQMDDHIRLILMNGSRVNPRINKDIFQDYDVANFVTDIEPFKNEAKITSHFGETIFIQKPEDKIWPPAVGDGRFNYNIQFTDGNRIDLSFYFIDTLSNHLKESLTKVLLDKDNIVPNLPPPSEQSYFIKIPTQKLYDDCCDEFIFGLGSHIPKTIWRKELPLLKYYIEVVLRRPLIKILEWEIGIKTGFEKSIGKTGKHLQKYLEPEVWKEFKQTYSGADFDDIWESLFVFYKLFIQSAKFVANEYGFRFPEEEGAKALDFLKHVKNLPSDALTIY